MTESLSALRESASEAEVRVRAEAVRDPLRYPRLDQRRDPVHAPTVVGVVNVTPDSFSDGGHFLSVPNAVAHAELLMDEGADIIEVGGESTRPGAHPVSAEDEAHRVVPVIRELAHRHPGCRIAIDTVKSHVARRALDAGASIVNDVSAFRLDPEMAATCAAAGCTVVLMHSRGGVDNMASYTHATYKGDVVDVVLAELHASVNNAVAAGVSVSHIVLDPGVGFAKTPRDSITVLAGVPRLLTLGFPIMVGASRKRFLGELTGVQQSADRDHGTVGANVAAFMLGATWFRVHDVRANRHALDVAAAIAGVDA